MSIILKRSIHRFSHHAMSTVFEVVTGGMDKDYAGQAAQAVFYEIDRLERLLSRFDATSEVGRINRLRPGEELSVGIEIWESLKISEKIHRDTGGAFDINVRSRTRRKAGIRFFHYFKRRSPGGFPLQLTRSDKQFMVSLSRENSRASDGGIDIDLGGIGKGYALDKAFEILRDWKIENAFIHAGTSTVLASGSPPGSKPGIEGWPLGVAGGWEKTAPVNKVILKDRALSGSGKEIKGEHIIDPFTGKPTQSHAAVWVSHPGAAEADALSTAFMVMDTNGVNSYCRDHPEVWVLLIKNNGETTVLNQALLMVD
ncbi:MAG: FAD:protein FMN transferase [Candidatus Aminicenantes bacterium]|nr:FAD:protein FMN transferase [Candidatus Aminicenantes bacterium]